MLNNDVGFPTLYPRVICHKYFTLSSWTLCYIHKCIRMEIFGLKSSKTDMLLPSFVDFFHQVHFSKNSFRKTINMSNGLDPDEDGHNVGPELGETVCKGY